EGREAAAAQPRHRQGAEDAAQEGPGGPRRHGAGRPAQGIHAGGQEARQGGGQARHPPEHGRPQEVAAGPPAARQGAGRQVRAERLTCACLVEPHPTGRGSTAGTNPHSIPSVSNGSPFSSCHVFFWSSVNRSSSFFFASSLRAACFFLVSAALVPFC